jgi:hypothetical protein
MRAVEVCSKLELIEILNRFWYELENITYGGSL